VGTRTGYNGGSDFNSTSYTADISAAFAGVIYVSGNIINSSDIRIKKEINDITDDSALQQILAIQPKTYKYIDYLSKNNSNVYGFIAQQVKEVIPHAVELVKDIIPNIYKRASCDSNIITLENNQFYFYLPEGRFETHFVAEGYRKIAMLIYLFKNGSLTKDSILLWDERCVTWGVAYKFGNYFSDHYYIFFADFYPNLELF
jgi:hypothetical protein